MKAHASESGQMHAQHPKICGQRSKMKIQGLSKQLPIFSLQRYRSARQSPVQNGVLGLDKQLQLFRFLCTNMHQNEVMCLISFSLDADSKYMRVHQNMAT
jgi:hypothetical protein